MWFWRLRAALPKTPVSSRRGGSWYRVLRSWPWVGQNVRPINLTTAACSPENARCLEDTGFSRTAGCSPKIHTKMNVFWVLENAGCSPKNAGVLKTGGVLGMAANLYFHCFHSFSECFHVFPCFSNFVFEGVSCVSLCFTILHSFPNVFAGFCIVFYGVASCFIIRCVFHRVSWLSRFSLFLDLCFCRLSLCVPWFLKCYAFFTIFIVLHAFSSCSYCWFFQVFHLCHFLCTFSLLFRFFLVLRFCWPKNKVYPILLWRFEVKLPPFKASIQNWNFIQDCSAHFRLILQDTSCGAGPPSAVICFFRFLEKK